MSANLNQNQHFVPPYPVTPPATPRASQSTYFPQSQQQQQQQQQHVAQPPLPQEQQQEDSITSPSSPPPIPPKLPTSPIALNGPPPPLPVRNGMVVYGDQARRRPQGDYSHLQHTPHSNSLPLIPLVDSASEEDQRRRSDEHSYTRRPIQGPPSSFVPPRSDVPPPPPPKNPSQNGAIYQMVDGKMSQVSLADLNSGEKRRRRKDSKGPKDKAAHMGEVEKIRRQKNASRSRLRVLSLGKFTRFFTNIYILNLLT